MPHLGDRAWLVLVVFVVFVIGVLAAIVLGFRLARFWRAVRLGRSRRGGARGERRALRLLERHGYTIVARQEAAVARVLVDGVLEEFDLRADLVVEKDGERLVAEVKTGAAATVASRTTRRQLLEYAYAFRLDGLLLVDMAAERIIRIEFLGIETPR
jgi:Holliday junction resolvase